jgi:hypothetical protein
MTAELADCFTSKQAGVEFIVHAVVESFPDQSPLFYRTDGTMCDARTAINRWGSVAASNWHALARLAFAETDNDSGFVFDIGSTTCDIIPVRNGIPTLNGQSDLERLTNGQLFYAGVGRTPVCSIISKVQLASGQATIARELFATMADVFLWLDQLGADESSTDTADGRPFTKRHAGQRLARMVCAEFDDLGTANIDAIAVQAQQELINLISGCLGKVVAENDSLPLLFRTFGKGAWLVDDVIAAAFDDVPSNRTRVISFSDDEIANQTAPALAVAETRQIIHSRMSLLNG